MAVADSLVEYQDQRGHRVLMVDRPNSVSHWSIARSTRPAVIISSGGGCTGVERELVVKQRCSVLR